MTRVATLLWLHCCWACFNLLGEHQAELAQISETERPWREASCTEFLALTGWHGGPNHYD